MKSWLCGISVVLVLLANSRATARQAGTVPRSLLAAAELPLPVFMRMVARVAPAGFETRESEDVFPLFTTVPDGQSIVALSELVVAFNRANRNYRAEIINGVFVVRPIDGRSTFLDSPSPITEPTNQIGVMRSLRVVLSAVDADLVKPGRVSVGATTGQRMFEALSTPIVLDGSKSRRVIDTLNQVALQAPGAWQVITRPIADEAVIVRFAFIFTDGARARIEMPGYTPSPR